MVNTGERPVPGDQRSLNRYCTAVKYARSKRVIDFGCGIGVGYGILKPHVKTYLGLDVSAEAIDEAKVINQSQEFQVCPEINTLKLDGDLLLGLEVLEHMEKNNLVLLLHKIKESGLGLYMTTPNGNYYPYHPATVADRRGFHTWHYTYEELQGLFNIFGYSEISAIERDSSLGVFVSYAIYAEV